MSDIMTADAAAAQQDTWNTYLKSQEIDKVFVEIVKSLIAEQPALVRVPNLVRGHVAQGLVGNASRRCRHSRALLPTLFCSTSPPLLGTHAHIAAGLRPPPFPPPTGMLPHSPWGLPRRHGLISPLVPASPHEVLYPR